MDTDSRDPELEATELFENTGPSGRKALNDLAETDQHHTAWPPSYITIYQISRNRHREFHSKYGVYTPVPPNH